MNTDSSRPDREQHSRPADDAVAPSFGPVESRVERLEELAMFTDREHEELRTQIAEVLSRLASLTRRLEQLEMTMNTPDEPGTDDAAADLDER
ncbi:MAG: hypothetical protein K2X32_05320 [Phycisphaerales bacterium]|nr:hypothetical protein [Phycisphaerales bacterium]